MPDPLLVAGLIPPLVGCLTGYCASRLAIRLLFKPRKPWRLFQFRLPLTPGAFGAGRQQLAHNLGAMVGGQLLNQDEIRRAVENPRFQEHLHHVVGARLEELLNRDLGPAATLVPSRFRSLYEMGSRVLRWRFLNLLHTHLDSPAFADALGQRLAGGDDADKTIALLRSPQFKRLLDALFIDLLEDKLLAQPIGPLAKLLPEEAQAGIADALARQIAALLAREVPELAATMRLQAIVARRVDALDPRQFEALLWPAIAPRVRVITLLGALLGTLLGAAPPYLLAFL